MSSNPAFPVVEKTSKTVAVEFCATAAPCRVIPMPMVLDLDRYGAVIGIELISIRYYGGLNLFHNLNWEEMSTRSGVRFNYSDTDDVLYVKLDQDRSLDQRAVDGRLIIDPMGTLVRIEADLVEFP